MRTRTTVRAGWRALWTASPSLMIAGLLMVPVLLMNLSAAAVDHRLVAGAPVWIKPVKFALSTALYAFTLAWFLRYLPTTNWRTHWAPPMTAVALFIEVVVIDLQAMRGTTSHFNVATLADATLFAIMAVGVSAVLLAGGAIGIAVFRTRFDAPGLGLILRSSIVVFLVSSTATGVLMVTPRHDQLAAFRHDGHVGTLGAHTVGAPDGTAGIPVVGWSAQHGDLRVAHFLGLHSLQLMPLLYFIGVRRLRPATKPRVRFAWTITASYGAAVMLLALQALVGQSIAAPTTAMLVLAVLWTATSAAFAIWAKRESRVPPGFAKVTARG